MQNCGVNECSFFLSLFRFYAYLCRLDAFVSSTRIRNGRLLVFLFISSFHNRFADIAGHSDKWSDLWLYLISLRFSHHDARKFAMENTNLKVLWDFVLTLNVSAEAYFAHYRRCAHFAIHRIN